MISKSYRKFTTFPTGHYSVFLKEDCLSNKDSSDEIIGQSPVGNIVNFAFKICRHRLYTGCKGCRIIGVSGFRHKRRTRPFSVYEECAQLFEGATRYKILHGSLEHSHESATTFKEYLIWSINKDITWMNKVSKYTIAWQMVCYQAARWYLPLFIIHTFNSTMRWPFIITIKRVKIEWDLDKHTKG